MLDFLVQICYDVGRKRVVVHPLRNGGVDMATSSIFHDVKIDTPEKAEAFVAALEASEKEPWVRVSGPDRYVVETNPTRIRSIMEMNRKSRESVI